MKKKENREEHATSVANAEKANQRILTIQAHIDLLFLCK